MIHGAQQMLKWLFCTPCCTCDISIVEKQAGICSEKTGEVIPCHHDLPTGLTFACKFTPGNHTTRSSFLSNELRDCALKAASKNAKASKMADRKVKIAVAIQKVRTVLISPRAFSIISSERSQAQDCSQDLSSTEEIVAATFYCTSADT